MSMAADILAEAHTSRLARVREADELTADEFLDSIGLSEERCIELALDPVERNQLKGIIARLRGKKHAFTTCMRDLRKHKPEWTDDRRKRTCAVLKQAAKGSSSSNLSAEGICPVITDGMADMLEHADLSGLERGGTL